MAPANKSSIIFRPPVGSCSKISAAVARPRQHRTSCQNGTTSPCATICAITRSRVDTLQELWQLNKTFWIRLSASVGLSARFPIASPAGWFDGAERNWLLADIPTRTLYRNRGDLAAADQILSRYAPSFTNTAICQYGRAAAQHPLVEPHFCAFPADIPPWRYLQFRDQPIRAKLEYLTCMPLHDM
jgi:hypothetical protein